MTKILIHNDWQEVLGPEFDKAYYQTLHQFLKHEYQTKTIHPDMYHIFQAFEWTPFAKVKVVLLGQDPYHGPHQAHGCSFSVLPGTKVPPSLVNIYKELYSDLGIEPVQHGYLKHWAEQGVLLLNSVLTVEDGRAFSHRGKGWEQLTDKAIACLSQRGGIVFVLWGNAAKAKAKLIDTTQNTIISSSHPSPLGAHYSFFGSKPFSKINQALIQFGEAPIDWQLPKDPGEA